MYILTNKNRTVLYTGMTNDLLRRLQEHTHGTSKNSFTTRYRVNYLVWYEIHETAYSAISREKQIKGGSRQTKVNLIQDKNPEWKDLTEQLQ